MGHLEGWAAQWCWQEDLAPVREAGAGESSDDETAGDLQTVILTPEELELRTFSLDVCEGGPLVHLEPRPDLGDVRIR